jgi:hypothetical protein
MEGLADLISHFFNGIGQKRQFSSAPDRFGRTLDWTKVKSPASPAAKRDAEGFDWGLRIISAAVSAGAPA